MNCDEIREQLELNPSTARSPEVEAHLGICPDCRTFESRVAWESALLTATFKTRAVSEAYVDDLLATVRAQTVSRAPGGTQHRFNRWLALAASLVLLFGGYGYLGATGIVPWPWAILGLSGASDSDRGPEHAQPAPVEAIEVIHPQGRWLKPPNDAVYGDMFFKYYQPNPDVDTENEHISRFSADVDTAAYTLLRRYLRDGHLPPKEAIRIEEIVNRFRYEDPLPEKGPVALHVETATSPFSKRRHLLRIAVRAAEPVRPPANITVALDVSGSMALGGRFDLARHAIGRLIENLQPSDRLALVTFGGRTQTVLPLTGIAQRKSIVATLERLAVEPGGTDVTHLAAGLQQASRTALELFDSRRINRVILFSDGMASVQPADAANLARLVAPATSRGVTLTCVGVGIEHYNDYVLEQLANRSEGNYYYLDAKAETDRIFARHLAETLHAVAHDVRFTVDFNPDVVTRFRLLGYESRSVENNEPFSARSDGAEIGAGGTVTAIYEIRMAKDAKPGTLAKIDLHYLKALGGKPIQHQVRYELDRLGGSYKQASRALRLSAAVAWVGDVLRKSHWGKQTNLEELLPLLREAANEYAGDPDVAEFVNMIEKAQRIRASEE